MLGLFAQLNAVKRQLETLASLNLELAKLEGKQKATALGLTAGLAAGAAALVFYGIGFAFAAAAAGLAEALPLWLSLLIVAVALFLVAGILAFLARRFARKATPPQPAQAMQEADLTLKTLRGNG
jgi:membrane protein implicated in regulation of membrane protease activity